MKKQSKSQHGLILVYTGNGKGKTSAALGAVLRGAGYGWKMVMIQFVKGTWFTGELKGAALLQSCFTLERSGKGFYKILDDRFPEKAHRQAAKKGIEKAKKILRSKRYDLVILDEINVALQEGLVTLSEVKSVLKAKPATCHLLLTGRNAHPEIIKTADLVTEMREVKHPFQKGIPAQKGIDF